MGAAVDDSIEGKLQQLAKQHRHDREAYTDGKDQFVQRVVKLALA